MASLSWKQHFNLTAVKGWGGCGLESAWWCLLELQLIQLTLPHSTSNHGKECSSSTVLVFLCVGGVARSLMWSAATASHDSHASRVSPFQIIVSDTVMGQTPNKPEWPHLPQEVHSIQSWFHFTSIFVLWKHNYCERRFQESRSSFHRNQSNDLMI